MSVSAGRRTGSAIREPRQQAVDVMLDAPVGRAEVLAQQPGLLAVAGEQIAAEVEHLLVADAGRDRHAHRRELEQDRADGGRRSGSQTAPSALNPTERSRSIWASVHGLIGTWGKLPWFVV